MSDTPTDAKALLLFQVGSVQEFIVQARSTRDGWSGSYLISWLMAHALKRLSDECKDVEIIFPDVSMQPLVQFLEKQRKSSTSPDEILTPNLPNVFCALLPAGANSKRIVDEVVKIFTLEGEWGNICNKSLCFLNQGNTKFNEFQQQRWLFQTQRHWQPDWQLWPWEEEVALAALKTSVPMLAGKPVSADGWNENYQMATHRLNARRNTREFDAWERVTTAHKDYFSGKEEVVAGKAWLDKAQRERRGCFHYLFRNGDELGAVNLIKRVWHKCYLAEVHQLKRAKAAFDSVPAVAAAPWRAELERKVLSEHCSPSLDAAFTEFHESVWRAQTLLTEDAAKSLPPQGHRSYDRLLNNPEISIFAEDTWTLPPKPAGTESDPYSDAERTLAENVLRTLSKLSIAAHLREPGRYFAVLAFDGDSMGKWLSGDLEVCGKDFKGVTQNFHTDFSSQLSGFALGQARAIVERDHNGTLIYAGGDDVLALLPATQALQCAKALMDAFAKLQPLGSSKHLTGSAGISIGHTKAPLQDMIEAARNAEDHAKRELGRDAMAITLYKRSGEIIQWGCKRKSAAWELLSFYQQHSRAPLDDPKATKPISGRFPHRLAELLTPYGEGTTITNETATVVLREFEWIVERQTESAVRDDLKSKAKAFVGQLQTDGRTIAEFLHLFSTEAFIARQGDQ